MDGFVTVDAVDRSTDVEESDLLVVVVSAAATPARRASANIDHLMMQVVVCARDDSREWEEGLGSCVGEEKMSDVLHGIPAMDDVFSVSAWREITPDSFSTQPRNDISVQQNPSTTAKQDQRNPDHAVSKFRPTRVWWRRAQREMTLPATC